MDGPTCAQCGAPMVHYRTKGYRCSRDERHEGMNAPWIKGRDSARQPDPPTTDGHVAEEGVG